METQGFILIHFGPAPLLTLIDIWIGPCMAVSQLCSANALLKCRLQTVRKEHWIWWAMKQQNHIYIMCVTWTENSRMCCQLMQGIFPICIVTCMCEFTLIVVVEPIFAMHYDGNGRTPLMYDHLNSESGWVLSGTFFVLWLLVSSVHTLLGQLYVFVWVSI